MAFLYLTLADVALLGTGARPDWAEVKAVVTLNLSDMGRVKKVRIGAVRDKNLKTCLRRIIKRWVFTPCGEQAISFPLIFRGRS